jgi:hypothetical protein
MTAEQYMEYLRQTNPLADVYQDEAGDFVVEFPDGRGRFVIQNNAEATQ